MDRSFPIWKTGRGGRNAKGGEGTDGRVYCTEKAEICLFVQALSRRALICIWLSSMFALSFLPPPGALVVAQDDGLMSAYSIGPSASCNRHKSIKALVDVGRYSPLAYLSRQNVVRDLTAASNCDVFGPCFIAHLLSIFPTNLHDSDGEATVILVTSER